MLKEYVDRNYDSKAQPVCSAGFSDECSHGDNTEMEDHQHDNSDEYPKKLQNSDVFARWFETIIY